MAELLRTAAAAVGLFAGTNVDDLIVLTVLFLSARSGGLPKPWQIWIGQYAGVALLVAASLVAVLGLSVLPDRWVHVLGLIPLGMGVWGLIGALRSRGRREKATPVATGWVSVAAVTVANGSDNLSVYIPVFRTQEWAGTVVAVTVFAAMVAVWCLAGSWFGSHRKVITVVDRCGPWLVPLVFVVLGVIIVAA